MIAGALNILFGADTKQVERAMKRVKAKLKEVGRTVRTVAGAVMAAGSALAMWSRVVGKNVQENQKWAEALGVPAQRLAALKNVAAAFGVEGDKVADAMKDLSERIADASTGTKTYEEALNRIGLKSKDLIGLRADEQYLKVASALGTLTTQADKNFVVAELMADAGFEQIAMFDALGSSIGAATDALIENGETMSEQESGSVLAMNDALTKLGVTVGVASDKFIAELSPAVEKTAKIFDGWLSSAIPKLGELAQQAVKVYSAIGFWLTDTEATLGDILSGETWSKAMKKGANTAKVLFMSTIDGEKKVAKEKERLAKEEEQRKKRVEIAVAKPKAKEAKEKKIAATKKERELTYSGMQIDPNQIVFGGMQGGRATEQQKELRRANELAARQLNVLDQINQKFGAGGGTMSPAMGSVAGGIG